MFQEHCYLPIYGLEVESLDKFSSKDFKITKLKIDALEKLLSIFLKVGITSAWKIIEMKYIYIRFTQKSVRLETSNWIFFLNIIMQKMKNKQL